MVDTRRVMLAAKAPEHIQYPVVASVKIDGIRMVVRDDGGYSRSNKLLPNRALQQFISQHVDMIRTFDGELTVGPPNASDCMQRTTSAIMSRDGTPDFQFWVFDTMYSPEKPYQRRYTELSQFFAGIGNSLTQVKLLPHLILRNDTDLHAYEQQALDLGYEGVMLRDPNGPYKFGRSTQREGYLLKLKRFHDEEGEVIDIYEKLTNTNEPTLDECGYTRRSSEKAGKVGAGTLGGFVVRRENGTVIHMRGRISAAEADYYWKYPHKVIGKIVKFKHFACTGVKDNPRFPVFLGFRDPIDMVDY